jgi:hypothetical protein
VDEVQGGLRELEEGAGGRAEGLRAAGRLERLLRLEEWRERWGVASLAAAKNPM